MRSLTRTLFVVSFAGLVLLLAVHIAALAGATAPFTKSIRFVTPVLFVIWIPTIIVVTRLTRDFKQKDIWRAALRGCPTWMRRTTWVIFGYSWLSLFILPALYGGTQDDAYSARMISAVMMAFYMVAAAVSYSGLNAERRDVLIRCANGHAVQPLAKFCEECGAPVSSSTVGTVS